jgi:radical SAM superfamily enzyme YgiQ (UPF0313 family)
MNSSNAAGIAEKKRILIVNCYFPESREAVRRINEVPDTLAPVLLAGHFSESACEIKLYNEVNSGFIEVFSPALLRWPDLVVLTGLTAAFDRMLHITAYVKSHNSKVIVAAGGHGVRSLPAYSRRFFDFTCIGDIEEIREVIEESLGVEYLSEEFKPRYDLAYWMRQLGYLESSRNCNFRCSFCSLTATGRSYEVQPYEYLKQQLATIGKRWGVFFNDNQLIGDGKKSFGQRMALVKECIKAGQFKYWGGFVTDTFFWDAANVDIAKESGCLTLFVGVESFSNQEWLDKVNKKQNAKQNQVELITDCIDKGILFQYGLVFDPTERTIEQMYEEMDIICATPEIPLPLFTFTAIPFPGTPLFKTLLEQGKILPNTKIRDLESSTLCLKSIDPIDEVVNFIKTGKNFRNYRKKALTHQVKFIRRYWSSLNWSQKIISSLGVLAMLFPRMFSSPTALFKKKGQRTHISTTDILDAVYTPCQPVANEYKHYFEPTILIDAEGNLNPLLADDAVPLSKQRATEEKVLKVKAVGVQA